MTTPSNATVVVDLPSLDVVACLSQAHAPILALAARITFRRRSSSDPVASVVVFRFLRARQPATALSPHRRRGVGGTEPIHDLICKGIPFLRMKTRRLDTYPLLPLTTCAPALSAGDAPGLVCCKRHPPWASLRSWGWIRTAVPSVRVATKSTRRPPRGSL